MAVQTKLPTTPIHRSNGRPNGVPPRNQSTPIVPAEGRQLLAHIRHLGRTLDDIEKLRIQHQLRRMAFEREHHMPLPPDAVFDQLQQAEHEAELELVRLWRKHPLAPWAKQFRGLGEKSIARLIAEIGGERVNKDTGEVHRAPIDSDTISQLWAYCGYDPNRKRRKGMSQEEALACGNPRAKKQCWLIATSMLKSGNRNVYDARRATTADREGWTLGHQHNDALRVTAKDFLKQLWIASRHSGDEAQ